MGHYVHAFIGEYELLSKVQTDFGVSSVCLLTQDLALLPLDDVFYDAIANTNEPSVVPKGFQFLSKKILNLLIRYSVGTEIGYIETEYFGGIGEQGAVLARDGHVIWGPQIGQGSINSVLQQMGIEKSDAIDEFAAVGLHRYRNNEDWILAGKNWRT